MTYQEMFDSAMQCTTKEEADAWIEEVVARCIELAPDPVPDLEVMKGIIRSNLGYMAGYCDDSVRDKVRDLFGALHPIFGDHRPTPEEALAKGIEMGMRMRNKHDQ